MTAYSKHNANSSYWYSINSYEVSNFCLAPWLAYQLEYDLCAGETITSFFSSASPALVASLILLAFAMKIKTKKVKSSNKHHHCFNTERLILTAATLATQNQWTSSLNIKKCFIFHF